MTQAPAPRTLVFLGDSITDCGRREDPDGLGYGYVRLIAEYFAAHEPGARVINRGMGGDKVADVAARFEQDVLALDPQVVTIFVGVNDVWHGFTRGETVTDEDFERGYRYMLDQLSATRPGLPVLLVIPFVVDVDDSFGQQARRLRLTISTDQLEFFGVQEQDVFDTIAILNGGQTVG